MPYFGPEQYTIVEVQDKGRKLVLSSCTDGKQLVRHPGDVKLCHFETPSEPSYSKRAVDFAQFPQCMDVYEDAGEGIQFGNIPVVNQNLPPPTVDTIPLRRSGRATTANPRYYNSDFVNY